MKTCLLYHIPMRKQLTSLSFRIFSCALLYLVLLKINQGSDTSFCANRGLIRARNCAILAHILTDYANVKTKFTQLNLNCC